ncbi:MAG TPA: type 4a pilus biogenesis protein PilO [Thermoanaerobaculia bacterium]|nr:type 4a pilus biogenesis protein PilO [Thermoanaerobaculia bacterium]
MAIQTGLEGKPWSYGLAVGAILGAVVLGLVWWRLVAPMNQEIAAQETRLSELQNKISEGRAAKLQLPQFRERVRSLELELDKLLRILPARRNTPDLLRRIRALAEQGDFDLIAFNPGTFIEREFYSEWPIAIQMSGGYHQLAMFFDRVSRLSRIINIENLQINARAGGENTIGASFNAKTFVYKEPETSDAIETTPARR